MSFQLKRWMHRLPPVPQFSVRSVLPSPDRSSSCGGAGLGAPVIPPSRAGFPLRPRPLEGLRASPRPRVARSPFPGGVGHSARSRVWTVGVCAAIMGAALNLAVPGGGTGPGASRPRRTPSAVRGGQVWDWTLAGFRSTLGCGLVDFTTRLFLRLEERPSPPPYAPDPYAIPSYAHPGR